MPNRIIVVFVLINIDLVVVPPPHAGYSLTEEEPEVA